MKNGLFACVALSLLTIFLWRMPNRPQAADITMPAAKFNSLSYAPYRAWQSPTSKTRPSGAQVAADLHLIAGHADGIRTYASIEGNYDIGALAQQAGLKVWLGIWLSSNPADNAKEIAAGIAEANAHPDSITRVIVGNEVLLRRDLSAAALMADIDDVRARVKQPVAYADVTDFWRKFPQVADHVDIVMIHFLPYWENHPMDVNAAIGSIGTTIDSFKAMFPKKTITIGETGWPSRGRWRKDAAPSRVNEAVFLRKFVSLAAREHVDYNLIEAFDQPWKYQDEGVAGANWGIWNAERVQKFPLNGGVVEHLDWLWYALLGAFFGTLLFASTRFENIRLAVPSFLLGNGFAIACAGTLPVLYDDWLVLDALVNLPLQAIFAFRILHRVNNVLSGRALPPSLPAAVTFSALRRGRLLLDYDSLWTLFLAGAAVFQAMLVFDPRYRDAPIPVFIIPVIAAVLRFWTRDLPRALTWEDLLAANGVALGALASAIMEGPKNLEFIVWNVAALILAGPVLMIQDKASARSRRR
jgi:exo-beta-1,3-glucanase (GH17 family)